MFRIFSFIFIIAMEIVIGSIRYSDPARDRYLFPYSYITKKLRRARALKRCKNFLKRSKSTYKLENDYVVVILNTKTKILRCYNEQNRKETLTVNWNIERNLTYNEELFDERFDYICEIFNSRTNYLDICNEIIFYFNDVKQTKATQQVNEFEVNGIMPLAPDLNLLDINSANEKEITDLPGINIILAKKIIKYRTENRGFDDLNEFYTVMKIKPHFIKKLENLICVNEYKIPEKKKRSEDRIIDF